MSERAPYSRVYWSVMDDSKFDGVREDMRHFGSWSLLLIVADMAWPAPAFIPRSVPRVSVKVLSECGLIDLLTGGRYRLHGLDGERGRRTEAAAASASKRWSKPDANASQTQSERSPNGVLDETRTRRDETRRANARPRASTVDKDPLLRQIREVQEKHYAQENGTGPTRPSVTAAELEREAHRQEGLRLHEQFQAGELTEAEYERQRDDIGKEADDLTRTPGGRHRD